MQQTLETLLEIIKSNYNKNATPTHNLNNLGIDSLDIIELVYLVEDQFNITVDFKKAKNMTVEEFAEMIENQMSTAEQCSKEITE